jgi:hypothetical protein
MPRRAAALALADSLAFLLKAETARSPTEAFEHALANIERGDDSSVDSSWPIVQREIANALPDGYAPMRIQNFARLGLEKRLSGYELPVIEAACELMAATFDAGDAADYLSAWGML